MMRLILTILLLLPSLIYAEKPLQLLPSIDWQKKILKYEIETKVNDTLKTMLKADEFVVVSTIEIAEPKMPNFYKQEFISDEQVEEVLKEQKGIKNNVDAETDPYGYIVFQKLGLEAPILEDFSDKIKKVDEKKPSYFENIWKYNDAINIYKNIDFITVAVKVTDDIKADERTKLEKIVREINFNIPNQTPNITFDYVAFKLKRSSEEPKPVVAKAPLTFLDKAEKFLKKFQLMISLLVTSILLGIIGFILLKKYQSILEQTASGASSSISIENKKSDDDDKTSGAPIQGSDHPVPVTQTAVERFVSFYDNAPRECVSMLRVWIRESSEQQRHALGYLIEELKNEKLSSIVSALNEEEKSKLRSITQETISKQDKIKAQDYVSIHVRSEILKGEKIDDPEVQEMLLALSPKNAAQLILKHPESISYLFNKLTAQFLGLIIENIPNDKKDFVLNEAIKNAQIDLKAFKTILPKFVDIEMFSPTLEKLKMIIPEASAETENNLYITIAKNSNLHSVKMTAIKTLPTSLIKSLPSELLRECLLQYEAQKRIEYLESISEDDKNFYLDIFAPLGSKARDIYELDYERFSADESRVNYVLNNKNTIQKDYVRYVRQFVSKNPNFQSKVDQVVTDWANLLMSRFTKEKPQLKAA